jgi:hypothetical protein
MRPPMIRPGTPEAASAVSLKSVVDRCDLSKLPIPITVTVERRPQRTGEVAPVILDMVRITFSMRVPDRVSRLPITVAQGLDVERMWPTEQSALEFVREMIVDMMLHEVSEQMLFGGVRIFDPHAHGEQ